MQIIKLWHKFTPYKFELVFDEAIKQKNMEVIDFLLTNNTDKRCTEHTVGLTIEYGQYDVLERIFAECQSVRFDDKAFYHAIAQNNLNALILLHECTNELKLQEEKRKGGAKMAKKAVAAKGKAMSAKKAVPAKGKISKTVSVKEELSKKMYQ